MASFELRSERQIQAEMLSSLIALLNLNDITPGSVIDVMTQAFAQQDFNVLFQVAQLSRLADIEFITRNDLDLKAFEYGLTRVVAQASTGLVSILRPAGFVKVTTNFSGATSNPIAGNSFIDVNDASNSLFGSSGTLVLGRGTNNTEEVSYSTAPMDNVSFWRILLDSNLINNHAIEETVILKQGSDEIILAGTLVRVLANGIQPEVLFSTENDVTLFSGEDKVGDVEVVATAPGSSGNINSKAITGTDALPTPPFTGAQAENSSRFTTGRDLETDDALRDRIKTAGASLTRGVKQAILNAIVGLVDPDSAKRVVSASVVLPVVDAGPVKVYIDDGTGFEPSFQSRGFETLRLSATGGESRLQLDKFPIQKATIENTLEETFDFSTNGLTLQYQVGILQEIITFNLTDFKAPSISKAEEVVTAINNKATLIEARTSQVGRRIVVTAKTDTNENIQILGGTANAILSFPTDEQSTLKLYLDDTPLSKDGQTATLDSQNLGPFNLITVGAFPHTLILIVDGKSANPQTATIQVSDVVDTSAVSVAEIVTVLNRDLSGLVSVGIDSNAKVRLISNTGLSASSKLEVTGGSMNDATNGLNFSTTELVGQNSDFILNRELGIVELTLPLTLNQNVTGGSLFTRAKLRAGLSELYTASSGETLIVSADGGADQTLTFDGTFGVGKTAEDTATFLNPQLEGALFVVRDIGSVNFLELRTNSYENVGSIEIKGTSTGNLGLQFPEDSVINSGQSNTAFKVSQNGPPFSFAQGDAFIVIVDNNILANTFATTMSRAGSVTTGTSTTQFEDSALNSIFLTADEIRFYKVGFTSGANTTSEGVLSVTDQGAGVFRYGFTNVPGSFGNYAIGDLFSVTALTNTENNGNFIVIAKGAQSVDVLNVGGVTATVQAGVGVLGQMRDISNYNQLSGEISVSIPFSNTPSAADAFIVLPVTINNVVSYLNNIRITPLSLKAVVEGVENNTRVQISSAAFGSDGFIQIPVSPGNTILNFDTDLIKGAATYNYWTGLLKLVSKTVYGDDEDLVSFGGIGAAGIVFQILAPTVNELVIEVDVTFLEGISAAALENEIKSQITSVVNSLGVGEDLIIEKVRAAVIGITGVGDVSLTSPIANVPAADNEILRVSDSEIVVG